MNTSRSASRIVVSPTVRTWSHSGPPSLEKLFRVLGGDQLENILANPSNLAHIVALAAPELRPIADKVLAWSDDRTARFTTKYDDDVQLAALALVAPYGIGRAFPGGWLVHSDVSRALRLSLASGRYVVSTTNGGLERAQPPGADAAWAFNVLLPYVRRLREQQSVGRELLGDVVDPSPSLQVALAILFEERAAIDAAADHAIADSTFASALDREGWARLALLGEVSDAARFEALARASITQLRFSPARVLAGALSRVPAETMATVIAFIVDAIEHLKFPPPASNFKELMMVAACVDDARTAEIIAQRVHVKGMEPIATEYFAQFSHRLPALEVAATSKGKRGASAKAVLDLVGRTMNAPAKGATDAESLDGVPAMLLTPPWAPKAKPSATKVAITIPDEPATHSRPGEHKAWLEPSHPQAWRQPSQVAGIRDIAPLREAIAEGKLNTASSQFVEGLMSVMGPESVPLLVAVAAKAPARNLDLLLHVVSPRAMVALATLLSRTKDAARIRAWLCEHADVAASGLVPAALSADAKMRAAGRAGLAVLAASGEQSAIDAVAGPVKIDVKSLTDEKLPAPRSMPAFANATTLPAPTVAATGAPLPRIAVENLLAMLSVFPKDARHPIADEVRAACTTESLDAFAWALVTDYVIAGASAREDWALLAAGQLGSDAIARKLDASMRHWIQKRVELMQGALDALALIGTDVALSLLYERGLAAKFEDTQQRARQLLEQVAARRGVDYEALEDKLVPELGLDQGPIVLDYGARTFEVKLDEQLAPYVIVAGERKEKPPKPSTADDAAKANAAMLRFETLCDDLSHVARTQLLRFERAMRDAREWSGASFRDEVVRHPLLRHVAPRLVWQVGGELVRVTEDGTFGSASDETVKLDDGARVRVAHILDAEGSAWAKMARVFADYAIVQPFSQLARETFDPKTCTNDVEYGQMKGRKASWNAVNELLTGRGWHRTAPEGGTVRALVLPLDQAGAEATAKVVISPGLTIGRVKARPEQTLGALTLAMTTFSALHPRVASEIIRDIATLTT